MGKILPILLAIIGLGGGIGAGMALRPPPAENTETDAENHGNAEELAGMDAEENEQGNPADDGKFDYVKLNNQFVVPIVNDARVSALLVLSLSLEIVKGGNETIYEREPKIRDALLQVLFDHANSGGFDGVFTNGRNMAILRDALKKTAINTIGSVVTDVLILDVVRQDIN